MGKLEWCRYPMVKKIIRFGATHERDGRTERHRVTAYTALMHMHRAVKTASKLSNGTNFNDLE